MGSVDIAHNHGTHYHYSYPSAGGGSSAWTFGGAALVASDSVWGAAPVAYSNGATVSLGITSPSVTGASISHTPASNGTIGVSAGYTETRPINKGVNYIIKY